MNASRPDDGAGAAGVPTRPNTASEPEGPPTASTSGGVRHSWVRLEIHRYGCRKCGTCYENRQDRGGGWLRAWFLSDGSKRFGERTPPCGAGKLTGKRLQHYAPSIARALGEREGE